MTLTTPVVPKRKIQEAFGILAKRIRRVGVKELEDKCYLKGGDVRKYYGGIYKKGLGFEYLKVETSEGQNGVYHIMFFGDFIPQAWLSDNWDDIIGAKVVDIRATKGGVKSVKKLARYCVAQYCAGQSEFVRYSWSWGWVFKGFVRVWKWLIRTFGFGSGVRLWNTLLSVGRRTYEFRGVAYSIGRDPPYIRIWMFGAWVDVLCEQFKVCRP